MIFMLLLRWRGEEDRWLTLCYYKCGPMSIGISRLTSLPLDLLDDVPSWQWWATTWGHDFLDIDLKGCHIQFELIKES